MKLLSTSKKYEIMYSYFHARFPRRFLLLCKAGTTLMIDNAAVSIIMYTVCGDTSVLYIHSKSFFYFY
jgi:hypothetical protein